MVANESVLSLPDESVLEHCPNAALAEQMFLVSEQTGIRLSSVQYCEKSSLPPELRDAVDAGQRIVMYIDPGTGSMLFSIVIGVTATGVFLAQSLLVKLKYSIAGGRDKEELGNKIPYVIFCESKRYWNVFKPVCDEMEARGIACEYWTTSEDDPSFAVGYRYVKPVFIGEGNKAFAKLNLMNADTCLATTPGLDVLQWKRSKNVRRYVHIFHALDAGNTYRMFGLDYYDAVLLTGDFSARYIRDLEELRSLPEKELTVTGSTYMDTLLERRRSEGDLPADHETTVLLAPSWGESSTLNRFGEKILRALLDTGYRIIVRPHPQSAVSDPELLDALQKQFPDGERLHWDFDRDNFPSLRDADIMISDFSGVALDYTLVFDRPLLYLDTSYDPAPYDAAWSRLPHWNFSILPKLGRPLREEDFPSLKSIVDEMIGSPAYRQGREEVRREAWQHIGEAAKRTVDYLTGKGE